MGYLGIMLNFILNWMEDISFFYVIYKQPLRNKRHIPSIFLCLCAAIGGVLYAGKTGSARIPYPGIILLITVFLYVLFEIRIATLLILRIGEWLLLLLAETLLHLLFANIPLPQDRLADLIMLLLIFLLWCYHLFFGRKIDHHMLQLPLKVWCFFDGILCILTCMIAFFSYVLLQQSPNSIAYAVGRIFILSGGILLYVLFILLTIQFNETATLRTQNALAQLYIEQQKDYYQEMLHKNEQTQQFRHDVINHYAVLQSYCDREDYVNLKQYLNDVSGVMESLHACSYDVGNDIINIILHYYLHPRQNDVAISVHGYIANDLPFKQEDLSVLIGNLLKNSIEGVDTATDNRQKFISFEARQGDKFLSIHIENSFYGTLRFDASGHILSGKEDTPRYGLGIRVINEIACKYDGQYRAHLEDHKYISQVYLHI